MTGFLLNYCLSVDLLEGGGQFAVGENVNSVQVDLKVIAHQISNALQGVKQLTGFGHTVAVILIRHGARISHNDQRRFVDGAWNVEVALEDLFDGHAVGDIRLVKDKAASEFLLVDDLRTQNDGDGLVSFRSECDIDVTVPIMYFGIISIY